MTSNSVPLADDMVDELAIGLDRNIHGLGLSNTPWEHATPENPVLESAHIPQPHKQLPRIPHVASSTSHQPTARFNAQQPPILPKANRKRPNQAQRRQMSSQFSIPIDPRLQPVPQRRDISSNIEDSVFSAPNRQESSQPRSYNHPPWAGQSSFTHEQHPPWNNSMPRFHHSGRQGPQMQPDPRLMTHDRPYSTGLAQGPRRQHTRPEVIAVQAGFLDRLGYRVVSTSEIERSEIAEKEAFRLRIETICRTVISRHESSEYAGADFLPLSVKLTCFGSLSSGFATKASDMDLGLFSPLSNPPPDATDSPIPRLLEKAFLEAGLGARLLSRTRVPIIKLCESPPEPLLHALIKERQKWESLAKSEVRERHGEDNHAQGTTTFRGVDECHVDSVATEGVLPCHTEFEVPCGTGGVPTRFQLRQGPNHSLPAYYGLAKRILRRAGGRDVTLSNFREFTDLDWSILNRVCEAFIRGLHDPELRKRLEVYPSLSFAPLSDFPNNHSLLAVFTQAEGEHAFLILQAWPAKAFFDIRPQAEHALRVWRDVQCRREIGIDPILYTKELQSSLEKVKNIPLIQLALLEQGEHELPSQFYQRTKSIMRSLQNGQNELSAEARDEVARRYIFGIYRRDIRQEMEMDISQTDSHLDLEAVSQRHQIVQLCKCLERSVEKEVYDSAQSADVHEYLRLLRSPLRRVQIGPHDHTYIIPLTPELLALLDRIRKLPDPQKVAPSQSGGYRDPLEFPKVGAGVQCDINFSAHLALHNTALLRCYANTDPRVRPMVLFVKHWAKVRGINSGYRGTLSSYGYVLMVLHYLVNIAQPFVCPNLQQLAAQRPPGAPATDDESTIQCQGYNVQFWRDENEILNLANSDQLNRNPHSLGHLLREFFEYFAQNGMLSSGNGGGFDWGRDVLSLRSRGGLLSKQEKGWTGAKTVFQVQQHAADLPPNLKDGHVKPGQSRPMEADETATKWQGYAKPSTADAGEVKEIRHRYLFAIEDPFELDHNVARTVTHNGIVSIRDEFRRAWKIIRTAERANASEDLLQDVSEAQLCSSSFLNLLDAIHGPPRVWDSAHWVG
ncbi:hypothetical protein RJ55_10013 [Drechmeria coniospora]|nr:hypothetical protein RJ55_10013 [Drechmeria coniospora]